MVRQNDLKCYKCGKDAVGHYITTDGKRILGCKEHFSEFPENRRGLFSASLLKQRQGMSNLQRTVEDATLKTNDPALRDIERKLREKAAALSDLVCPACGDGDRGNRMNGKPYCFKCQVYLVEKSKVKSWIPIKEVKHKRFGLPEQLKEE
jgi:hypothetical protein